MKHTIKHARTVVARRYKGRESWITMGLIVNNHSGYLVKR